MATAAPATGAPAPAAPAAAPATPAGEPNAPAAAAPAAAPKVVKPIPPPRLPGVLEDGPEDATTRPPDSRARDGQGRFVAGEPKDAPVVAKPKPTAVDAPDGEPIPEPPGEAKPFVFAGKSFKTQAEAEHYVKSMEGRYKPIQEAATRHEAQLVKAAESARGWHAEAQRLQAEIAALQSGRTEAPAEAEAASDGIDWALFAEIRRAANEAGTPEKADQWLQEQYDKNIRAEIARLREEAIENPRRAAEEQAALESRADALVNSMVDLKNPDGSFMFPEYRDGSTARQVGELWRNMGLDPQLALTEGGAVAAIALYRMANAMNPAPRPAPAPSAPAPPPDLSAAAAAELEGGRTLLPAATPRRELDPSVARLVAGLKNAQLTRPGLGFEA